MDLFAKLDDATVVDDPFPHAVVPDLIDPGVCKRLLAELPPLQTLSRGAELGNNRQFWLPALEAFEAPTVSPLWREVLQEGLSPRFMGRALQKFLPAVDRCHPLFEARCGARADELPLAVRRKGKPQPGALSVDAQIMVNTPALTDGTVARGPHLDKPNKLFVGLLYLRCDDDPSHGGELELYESVHPTPEFERGRLLPRHEVRRRVSVPYQTNMFAMFLNTPRSLHGISPRSVTPCPRVLVNFVCEVWAPLFDVPFREGEAESETSFDGGRVRREDWLSGWRGWWKRKSA